MTSVGVAEKVMSVVDERTAELLLRRRAMPLQRRGWLVRRALLAADLFGLTAAFFVAQVLLGRSPTHDQLTAGWEYLLFAASLPLWVVLAKLAGLYDRDEERTDHSTADDLIGVFYLVTVCTWLLFAAMYATPVTPKFPKLFTFWFAAVALVPVMRISARSLCRSQIHYIQNTVIVGAGDIGQLIARKLLQHPEYGLNLVGFVDTMPKERRADLGHLTVLGELDDLPSLIDLLDVERVIFAYSHDSSEDVVAMVRSLHDRNVQIDVVPRLFDLIGPRVDFHSVEGMPLLSLRPTRIGRSSMFLKRVLDVVLASLALVFTAPLFAWIAWRIRRDSRGPILFRQQRVGMDGREFTFLKFRTMEVGADNGEHRAYIERSLNEKLAPEANGLFKLDRRDAITPFGHFLRRTSLDELPQLLNVLRGDMSLVGPRPCIPYEVDGFEPHHHERFSVPAGMTGLWQVTARAHSTFREALDMDVLYARSWSLALDLKLLLRTPLQLLRARSSQ
jgi:exopolysaccharide biosynthesis polyprenyl glycosylphosphotransferase